MTKSIKTCNHQRRALNIWGVLSISFKACGKILLIRSFKVVILHVFRIKNYSLTCNFCKKLRIYLIFFRIIVK
ncbi:hypothetical protein PVMG_05404 [Plasmodium vivax Mauritania I]|uniref:Uncharacterized protein n=1 Tax=Plasmodium vivax Mauritania I TaxID=1035515 RepID=A0A0J9THU1_PLAVI|nr:hypothetical protein PVMG_05404 [Plasmodium vivax Mauritania I]